MGNSIYKQKTPNPYKLVTVQIKMEEPLRDALRLKAQFLGFDSIQAYIRFWALAEAEGRKINLDEHDWEPQPIFEGLLRPVHIVLAQPLKHTIGPAEASLRRIYTL